MCLRRVCMYKTARKLLSKTQHNQLGVLLVNIDRKLPAQSPLLICVAYIPSLLHLTEVRRLASDRAFPARFGSRNTSSSMQKMARYTQPGRSSPTLELAVSLLASICTRLLGHPLIVRALECLHRREFRYAAAAWLASPYPPISIDTISIR